MQRMKDGVGGARTCRPDGGSISAEATQRVEQAKHLSVEG